MPTRSPVVGDSYVITSRSSGSCCMSYSAAYVRISVLERGDLGDVARRSLAVDLDRDRLLG